MASARVASKFYQRSTAFQVHLAELSLSPGRVC